MKLTTCCKGNCWEASIDNGWCNRHTDERIAELKAQVKLNGGLAAGWKHTAERLEATIEKQRAANFKLDYANQGLVKWAHEHNVELEAQVAALTEAARQYMDLKNPAPWEEYNAKRTALAALIQESEDE